MTSPVTVYRHTDDGAPQLDNTMTGFYNVLRKCLVEGYGDKEPLGWTIPFEDTDAYKMVIHAPKGNSGFGGYCQLAPYSAGSNTSPSVMLIPDTYMSGVDEYTNPQKKRTIPINYSLCNGWVIIGTDRGFYWQRLYTDQVNHKIQWQYCGALFVGDIDSNYQADVGCFTALYSASTADDTSASAGEGVNNIKDTYYAGFLMDTDGAGTATGIVVKESGTAYQYVAESLLITPDTEPLTFVFREIEVGFVGTNLYDRNGVSVMFSDLKPYHRGVIAGMLTANITMCGDVAYPYITNINGSDYFPLCMTSGAAVWINIESWYNE
ncbi:hypothetical protein NVP1083O_34 [Vibrio phage 1.083.O._10N.286.52.B9]|nr:hypothetical protein NVP1083O_34 [Vibrio phage 1.083.O._10N.286.52.B9]